MNQTDSICIPLRECNGYFKLRFPTKTWPSEILYFTEATWYAIHLHQSVFTVSFNTEFFV